MSNMSKSPVLRGRIGGVHSISNVLDAKQKSEPVLIVFIGTFCDMFIIWQLGGQRNAVRLIVLC